MTRKQRRLTLVLSSIAVLLAAVLLVMFALRDSIVYFHSPSEVLAQTVMPNERIRIGGLVENGSVVRGEGEAVSFAVTDMAASVPVSYVGILPDLFREGQGVVIEGSLDAAGTFHAETVFAKHDENYMPHEAAEALKEAGHWQDGQTNQVSGAGKQ